jgi:predicted HTH domain antitoxin
MKEDLSTAVRDLITRGRLLLALDRYREGKASLSKAAELAGVSVSEMMDLLSEHGIPSDLHVEDYRESLRTLREAW